MVKLHLRLMSQLESLKDLPLVNFLSSNISINDLSDDLSSNLKLFADDTSLFLVIHDKNFTIRPHNRK